MKTQNGFILLENKEDVRKWLAKAKDGGTWLKCKSGYYVNKKYMEFVRYA